MRFQTITFGSAHTYVLENLLNETNYSKVYEAYDETAKREVCIKAIDLSVLGDEQDTIQCVERELLTMATLSGETVHIPCLLDSFCDDAHHTYYIVMQLCKGTSFREKLTTSTMPLAFLRYMVVLCDTLSVMHAHNLRHKDIKPENIRITSADDLILLDFNTSLSAPNLYEGTDGYRAPEMMFENITTDRSYVDVFAVGLILYEYFGQVLPKIGAHYYVDGNAWGDFMKPSEQPNALPLAARMDPIIMKCLAFNPKERYDMAALKRALYTVIMEIQNGK